jgi:beta-galactosidase/beta-glucuronidase
VIAMKATIPLLLSFVVLLLLVQSSAAQWKIPSNAPLLTRWAKDVTPENALPDYPRPQLVRDEWMNLNGLWQYREAKENEDPPFGEKLAGTILVPYPIESALSGVMKSAERLWYRRTAMLPKKWEGRQVVLHFGAVDWETKVFVNGKAIGQHRGGYDPISFDITHALKPGGEQEIVVGVFDPSDKGNQPRGKQVLKPSGIWYTPTTGIWQTVWLEPVAPVHISALVLVPDVDSSSLRITALSTDETNQSIVLVEALD